MTPACIRRVLDAESSPCTSGTTSKNSRNWILSMTLLRSSGRVSVASAHSPPYVATSCGAMTSDHCDPSSALAYAARQHDGL